MRIRLVLGVAVAVAVAGLVLDMSRAAPRTAGSDHAASLLFAPTVPAGGTICQKLEGLPTDAARVRLELTSYGKPLPAIELRFLDASGRLLATGSLPASTASGLVTIPLHRVARANTETASEACLTGHGAAGFAVGGEGVPVTPLSARIQGVETSARVSLIYLRPGRETWWQLLPTLAERFGFGKARFFGSWLLLVSALGLVFVWAMSIRLLLRELR